MIADALLGALQAWLQSVPHAVLLGAVAGGPIVAHVLQTCAALLYHGQWERQAAADKPARRHWPYVSVLVPVHNEARCVAAAVEAMLRMDYPKFEVIVIDDGSTDGSLGALASLRDDPRLRLVRKHLHEGKAMALNDALALARGSLLLSLNADAEPDPALLRNLVPHFDAPRVAAVVGQTRVRNAGGLLTRLQALQHRAEWGLQRRAERVWGRMTGLSGAVLALRRRSVLEVGGFSPDVAAADVDLGWKLQRRHYDLRYEARALCWMKVPTTWRAWWSQRLRAARGLSQVVRRHAGVWRQWPGRRMWPVWAVLLLSRLWALALAGLLLMAAVAIGLGLDPWGGAASPGLWALTIVTVGLLRLLVGLWLERGADGDSAALAAVAVWHPLLLGVLQAVVTLLSLPQVWRGAPAAVPAGQGPGRAADLRVTVQ